MSRIPKELQVLEDALAASDRRAAFRAVYSGGRTAGVGPVATVILRRFRELGRGSVRGSRFGRVLEVVDAALTLDRIAGAGLDALAAAADLLVVALPPSPARLPPPQPVHDVGAWAAAQAARIDEWGRPALLGGAAARLHGLVPDVPLVESVARSFVSPRNPPPLRAAPWIGEGPEGLVVAAAALFEANPGFREAAGFRIVREALRAGPAAAASARSFLEETRDYAARRLLPGPEPGRASEDPGHETFVVRLREAARREAVHSFGVVHALAAAAADLEESGSTRIASAARRVLETSRETWSPARPPGASERV